MHLRTGHAGPVTGSSSASASGVPTESLGGGQDHSSDWSALTGSLLRDQRARFVLTGAANTAFGYACFVSIQLLVGVRLGYMWTLLMSHIVSVVFAFFMHRRLVFKVTGSLIGDLFRFETVYLFGLAINASLLPLAVEGARLPVLLAQGGITALNAAVSWVGHSRFTFYRGRLPA